LNIIIESPADIKQEKYIYESLIKIPFSSSFRLKEDIKEITIKKENRTHLLEINNANDLEIHIQNRNSLLVHQVKEGDKNFIRFFVPNTIRENYENNLVTLTNKLTGQQVDIIVNYIESEGGIFAIFSREYLIDIITIIIIGFIIYILVYYNYSNQVNKFFPLYFFFTLKIYT